MTGQVVYKDKYFPRTKDENRIWRRLKKGSHILLLAPRRVGKTSLLRNIELNPKDDYVFLYSIVQSCSTEHEYYQTIIENLFQSEFTDRLNKLKSWSQDKLDQLMASVKEVKLSEAGITFENKDRTLNHTDLKAALRAINIDKKLIVVVDEFPDVLEKINTQHGHTAAESFLSGCRELWQDPLLDEKVQFIFTGSIGLDTLVNKLNLSDLINALTTTTVDPFTPTQAIEFLNFVINDSEENITLADEVKQHLLDKVGWLMPYYIDLLWLSLEDFCSEEEVNIATIEHVDAAYEMLFNHQYRSYFAHWAERLERLTSSEKQFAHQLLKLLSKQDMISPQEVHNLKQDPQFGQTHCNYVADCLEHDGYIFLNSDEQFQFTSPMLKQWWKRYAARRL
ncbi:MAG: hypothetical protein ACI8WB_002055 [Phenylobacterium sp.]|jgi:hypothetical protein